MRLLLDTHTFIWKLVDPAKVPPTVYAKTKNPDNELLLSAVSLWEIAIKMRKGKLDLGVESYRLIELAATMGIQTISLSADEVATYDQLTEDSHFDPFDRLLIWQAIQRDLILVSGDPQFSKFKKDGLKLLWK
jgi:PIN domain nuclease of toxin-antitoxin system